MSDKSQYAYILHVRPYTDSRLLIDFFSENSGLVRTVGRVPGKRHTAQYQSFQRMHIECWGASSLKMLRSCESAGGSIVLLGDSLYCGMYINELLQRLLPLEEPCPDLFLFYETAVTQLAHAKSRVEQEAVLRHFEFFLLEYLGFAVIFDLCAETEVQVLPDRLYYFEVGSGIREYTADAATPDTAEVIRGEQLLAMAHHNFTDQEVLRSAKKISRQALRQLLGPRPLKSRELFR